MSFKISPDGRIPQIVWLAVATVSLVVVVVLVYIAVDATNRGRGTQQADRLKNPAEGIRLLKICQTANGFLEDENEVITGNDGTALSVVGYLEACSRYKVLEQKLPNEILPVRNAAIARLLYYKNTSDLDDDGKRVAETNADEAISRLIALRPRTPLGYWLKARFLIKKSGRVTSDAVRQYEMAVEFGRSNIAYQYSLYDALDSIGDDESKEDRERLLKTCLALKPTNLVVITDLLVLQAEAEDESIESTLTDSRETLDSLSRLVLIITRQKLNELLQELATAIESADWSKVRYSCRAIQNVLKGTEAYKRDVSEVKRHELEFVMQTFDKEFYNDYKVLRSSVDYSAEVAFRQRNHQDLNPNETVRDVKMVDFNLDGRTDLMALTNQRVVVWTLLGFDEKFDLQTEFELDRSFAGILAADLDKDVMNKSHSMLDGKGPAGFDADADVVLWGEDGVLVLRNDLSKDGRSRSLVPVGQDPEVEAIRDVLEAVLIDVDHDSDLDIVTSSVGGPGLLLHTGTLTFADFSEWIVAPDTLGELSSLSIVDWDRDADIDIVALDVNRGAIGILENLRHGRMRWRQFGEAFQSVENLQGVAVLEADGNASWDLMTWSADQIELIITASYGRNAVVHQKTVSISSNGAEELIIFDCDNDGLMDVVSWTGGTMQLYKANVAGSHEQATLALASSPSYLAQVATADIDLDGDLDLVVGGNATLNCLENEGGEQNSWLAIRAYGRWDNAGRANHFGIGSTIELKSGDDYQAQVVTEQRTHFGLGKGRRPEVVRIVWTNGMPQNIIRPNEDQAITEVMYLKGSCPFLYTWDGEKFVFVTDCLWAAPIGLQKSEGEMVPTRSWEYLKIPGEMLQKQEGLYRIQLTEELWEAAYFDHVQLIAVDHPAEVEVFSNEKVGPPSISEFKVHTVQERQSPRYARDRHGRDVLDLVQKYDGKFYRGFDKILRQGYTEDHLLEVSLGELQSPTQIKLFLTGWIHPTDTSLNIAFSQDPEVDGPELPSIWVPDAVGEWKIVPAPMGFPGGKTKTIVVDLSDAFLTDDYRLQIRTSSEIYWDEVFFTVDDAPAEVRLTEMQVESADLHYRGFSKRFPDRENAPEWFDYTVVDREPKWPPMRGAFTRYGDVTPLLTFPDDMMAVLGSGDEMTVTFRAPEADPPSGWKRDFLLHNVGWDKDADLNTVHGQDVEPLPFREMRAYPYAPEQAFPDTPEHRDYLKRYQTRHSNWARFWKHIYAFDASAL